MDFQEYDEFQELYKNYLEKLKKYKEEQNTFKPFDRVFAYRYKKQALRATCEVGTIAEIYGNLCLVIFDNDDIEDLLPCKRLGVYQKRALWLEFHNLHKIEK